MKECVIPIQGDLSLDGLGMDPAVRKQVTEDLHVLISSAASVFFDNPLDMNLKTNYWGAVSMLKLAEECK